MSPTTRRGAIAAATVALTLTAACSSSSGSGSASDPGASTSGSTAFQAQHKGGTLNLVAHAAAGSFDPQVNYTLQYWQLFQSMYDGLLSFKKVGGQESFTVVPDLATALPKVTNGGKTYTFTLRKGVTFSNGKPLTTADVVASFQRIFKVSSPTAGTFYNGIVGAEACLKTPASCTLAKGVTGDAATNTVTINLTAADPEFEYKLAVPHAVVVPKDSPTKDAGTKPLPSTGPYTAASYDPNRALKLVRNPHFKEWSRQAEPQGYPDVINYAFGQTVESEVTAVENGQADWMFDAPAGRPAGRDRHQVRLPGACEPADGVLVRDAQRQYGPVQQQGGPPGDQLGRRPVRRGAPVRGHQPRLPACTVLPPGFPGHVGSCDYTKGGGPTWKAADLAKAKALVKQSGTAGQEVGIVTQDDDVNKSIGQYLQSLLTQLGYKATLKPLSGNIQFTYIQNTKNKVQLALTSWYQDYPAASDFLNVLLSCASYHPGSDSSINISGFCDKGVDAQMQAAMKTSLTDKASADKQWGAVDQAVMAQSPVVPLINPKMIDFTSKRVGNYRFSKQFYMLVGQLWVK